MAAEKRNEIRITSGRRSVPELISKTTCKFIAQHRLDDAEEFRNRAYKVQSFTELLALCRESFEVTFV